MSLSTAVSAVITTENPKALATEGPAGLNVVPISMVKVNPESIWLFDFFMDKTAKNITSNPEVALTAWEGMKGVQVRATASYITDGAEFEESVAWVKTQNPDRVVNALVKLTPTEVFDISPGGGYAAEELTV